MQDRRHPADDHPAAKGGEHEDVEGNKTGNADCKSHFNLSFGPQAAFVSGPTARGLTRLGGGFDPGSGLSLQSLPSCVRAVSASTSSVQSISMTLSFIIRASRLY